MEFSQQASRRTGRSIRFAVWLLAPGLSLALGACGGSQSGGATFADPDKATFDYGTTSDASGMRVVDTISQWELDARAELAEPGDAGVEYQRAFALAFLPMELAAEGPNDVPYTVMQRVYQQAVLAQVPWRTCVTASPEQVQYSGCRTTQGIDDYYLDGTLTRSGTTLAWDLVQTWNEPSGGEWHHLTGEVQVGAGLVTGRARADQTIYGFAFTDSADLSLVVDGGSCLVGGTVEMKRVWPVRQPDGMPSTWPDAGTLLVWTGCGAVTVAMK